MGGDNSGSTQNDRTNYWENVTANAVELPLFLEPDRMGFLVDAKDVRAEVEKWFGDIPRSEPVLPLAPRLVLLKGEKRLVLEDRVQLPRLYRRLVSELQVAQDANAFQGSHALARRSS